MNLNIFFIYKKKSFIHQMKIFFFFFSFLFFSSHEIWSRSTVYVFPPTYIGEDSEKIKFIEETLRNEIHRFYDLAHNPSYENIVVDFMKENSGEILDQFFYGECKEDCLLSQRILLQKLLMKSLYSLTVTDSRNVTKIVLLRVLKDKAEARTEYCESCNQDDLKESIRFLVNQLEGPAEIVEEEKVKDEGTTNLRARFYFGGASSSAVSSTLSGLQLFWGNLGLGYGKWRFKYKDTSYSMDLESNLIDFLYRYELPIENSSSDFGGDSYDLTIGLGIVTSGIGTLKRDDVKYSGSSVSGYQISSFFTQQRGLWEAFLGLSFQGKYYYDLRSSESGLIHDRRVNWVNFLIGLGIYY